MAAAEESFPQAADLGLRRGPGTRAANSAQLATLSRLPETAEEVTAIAEVMGADPEVDLFLRDKARETTVKTLSADGRGADAVSGLGRAFFFAGARALLVSNWPVHSHSTKELMVRLFQRYAENPRISRAEALGAAMNALITEGAFRDQSGNPLFAYAHPLFWAPFSLLGDGGTSGRPGA